VRLLAPALAALCAAALAGCGDTLQDQPIPHNILEGLIVSPSPVYWLGGSFRGLAVTEATHDPSGAFSVQYGNCLQGGQVSCVSPLRIVTSPDNSFLPGGADSHTSATVRGVPAVLARGGSTIEIQTGTVIIDIYASSPRLASMAARMLVPINSAGAPEAPLAAPQPDTGFGRVPLPSQIPAPLRPLG
jgi:hypothetical protein